MTTTCPTCGDRESVSYDGGQSQEPCPDCTAGIEGRCRECGDLLNGHDRATLCPACHIQALEVE